jgi:hypothetical protein
MEGNGELWQGRDKRTVSVARQHTQWKHCRKVMTLHANNFENILEHNAVYGRKGKHKFVNKIF